MCFFFFSLLQTTEQSQLPFLYLHPWWILSIGENKYILGNRFWIQSQNIYEQMCHLDIMLICYLLGWNKLIMGGTCRQYSVQWKPLLTTHLVNTGQCGDVILPRVRRTSYQCFPQCGVIPIYPHASYRNTSYKEYSYFSLCAQTSDVSTRRRFSQSRAQLPQLQPQNSGLWKDLPDTNTRSSSSRYKASECSLLCLNQIDISQRWWFQSHGKNNS